MIETLCLVKCYRGRLATSTRDWRHMADAPGYIDTDDANADDAGQGTAGTPRWVKVSAIVALVVVLLLVVAMVFGGEHGPGRHLGGDTPAAGSDAGGEQTRPSGAPEGHEPPSWVPEH
jgi:hypothetical protein